MVPDRQTNAIHLEIKGPHLVNRAVEDPGGTLEPQVGVRCPILVVQHVWLFRPTQEHEE
jgi:hypothetical protein